MKLKPHLPGFTAGLALGAGAVALAVWLRVPGAPAPEPPPAPEVAAGAPEPVFRPDPVREKEIGAALRQVKPGATRAEVEARLGPAHLVRWQQMTSRWLPGPDGQPRLKELPYVIYYCSPPDLPPGPHLMTIEYDAAPLEPIPPTAPVIRVSGPHTPDNCG